MQSRRFTYARSYDSCCRRSCCCSGTLDACSDRRNCGCSLHLVYIRCGYETESRQTYLDRACRCYGLGRIRYYYRTCYRRRCADVQALAKVADPRSSISSGKSLQAVRRRECRSFPSFVCSVGASRLVGRPCSYWLRMMRRKREVGA